METWVPDTLKFHIRILKLLFKPSNSPTPQRPMHVNDLIITDILPFQWRSQAAKRADRACKPHSHLHLTNDFALEEEDVAGRSMKEKSL
jgi:hypothetical protein